MKRVSVALPPDVIFALPHKKQDVVWSGFRASAQALVIIGRILNAGGQPGQVIIFPILHSIENDKQIGAASMSFDGGVG